MAPRREKAPRLAQAERPTGFAVLDSKGRLSLSKPVRQALGMGPGSTLAYIVVDGALLLIPQDEHLAALLDHAASVLEGAGLTPQDLLAELPAARAEVVEELYGAEFMAALARRHAVLRSAEADQRGAPPSDET